MQFIVVNRNMANCLPSTDIFQNYNRGELFNGVMVLKNERSKRCELTVLVRFEISQIECGLDF